MRALLGQSCRCSKLTSQRSPKRANRRDQPKTAKWDIAQVLCNTMQGNAEWEVLILKQVTIWSGGVVELNVQSSRLCFFCVCLFCLKVVEVLYLQFFNVFIGNVTKSSFVVRIFIF